MNSFHRTDRFQVNLCTYTDTHMLLLQARSLRVYFILTLWINQVEKVSLIYISSSPSGNWYAAYSKDEPPCEVMQLRLIQWNILFPFFHFFFLLKIIKNNVNLFLIYDSKSKTRNGTV